MVGGFAEDLENKITEAAEKKIKEVEGLVETKVGDLEYKTKADICCSCSECRWAGTAHVSATVCRAHAARYPKFSMRRPDDPTQLQRHGDERLPLTP